MFPIKTQVITPLRKANFMTDLSGRACASKQQGGNPKYVNNYLVFNGSMDGNRQVDPQIAVGGGFVFQGTNTGLAIYDKNGEFVQGVSQKCFNDGIDPKLFFDPHNRVFGFNLWWYYDDAKTMPANIAVSETDDPRGAWNIYPISIPQARDGGSIGYSKKWIGYLFPEEENRTFVLKTPDAKAGKPTTVYHFKKGLGHPVLTQDAQDDLYFFDLNDAYFTITRISEGANGQPFAEVVAKKQHQWKYVGFPPQSPQKGTTQRVASGDRNPKNVVLQGGYIWFAHAVDYEGRSAVQWHQIRATTGEIVQSGAISHDTSNYIQTSIAVNKKHDVLIGFQQVDENSFISPRFTYRLASDPLGTTRRIISIGEGRGATRGGASWGDYSGSMIDGDNLLDLWTIQSIANEVGRGETVIAKVPFKKKKRGFRRLFR